MPFGKQKNQPLDAELLSDPATSDTPLVEHPPEKTKYRNTYAKAAFNKIWDINLTDGKTGCEPADRGDGWEEPRAKEDCECCQECCHCSIQVASYATCGFFSSIGGAAGYLVGGVRDAGNCVSKSIQNTSDKPPTQRM